MPSCPNCGRDTRRTEDWVCQWCGYPLLSRSYKKIDKTYKQLQEERSANQDYREPEPIPEPEVKPEPEPKLEPEVKPEPEPKPEPEVKPEPEPELEPEKKPEPTPESEPIILPPPEPAPELKAPPEPEKKAVPDEPEPEKKPEPTPESEPIILPPPEPAPELKAPPEPEKKAVPDEPEPKKTPELAPEPEPEPELPPELEITKSGADTTVDALNHYYQTDKAATHARLKDQTIKVSGLLEKVFVRDHLDIRYLVLTGEKKSGPWSVRCSFGKESVSEMNRLSEGQTVKVQGTYDGYGKNIIIKDCNLI
jgi:hypothetical protein